MLNSFINRFSFKKLNSDNTKTYYSFNLIEVKYINNHINTYQVKSILIIFCNRMVKYSYIKNTRL
jgi:hypothetical protein